VRDTSATGSGDEHLRIIVPDASVQENAAHSLQFSYNLNLPSIVTDDIRLAHHILEIQAHTYRELPRLFFDTHHLT
jgi:hypothetical protein